MEAGSCRKGGSCEDIIDLSNYCFICHATKLLSVPAGNISAEAATSHVQLLHNALLVLISPHRRTEPTL